MVLLGVVVASTVAGALSWHTHQQGQANRTLCGEIEPGGRRADLITTLGTPQNTQANPSRTRLVLVFTSPLFTEKPIQAVVNVRDDVVMEIDCGDGRIKTFDKY